MTTYSISTVAEAQALLAKEDLTKEEVREMLLYFLHRDTLSRQVLSVLSQGLVSFGKMTTALLPRVIKVIPSPEKEEMLREISEASDLLQSLGKILAHQSKLQS